MNIDQVKTAAQNMQQIFSKISLPGDVGEKVKGTFANLTSEIEKF